MLRIFQGLVKSTETHNLRISNIIFHHHDTKLANDFQYVSKYNLNAGLIAVNFEDENLNQIIAEVNRYCHILLRSFNSLYKLNI